MSLDGRIIKGRGTKAVALIAVVAAALAVYGSWRGANKSELGGDHPRAVGRDVPELRSPSGRFVLTDGRLRDLGTGRSWVTGRIDEPHWAPGDRYLAFLRHRLGWTGSAQLFVLDLARPASAPRRVLVADAVRVRWIDGARLGFWREDVELGPTDAVVGQSASIGIVTPSGRLRTIHKANRYTRVSWSPRGDDVAFITAGGRRGRVATASARSHRPGVEPSSSARGGAVREDASKGRLVVRPTRDTD
jgi:hypothetical protein